MYRPCEFRVRASDRLQLAFRGLRTLAKHLAELPGYFLAEQLTRVGFALLNVAIAFAVSTLFAQANFSQPASYALGFVVTGGFYLVVGAIVVMLMKSRLGKQDLVPQRTVQELRKDKQWLKNEL